MHPSEKAAEGVVPLIIVLNCRLRRSQGPAAIADFRPVTDVEKGLALTSDVVVLMTHAE
jgi:hypothetical protein